MPLNTKHSVFDFARTWDQFELTAPPRRPAANFGAAICLSSHAPNPCHCAFWR